MTTPIAPGWQLFSMQLDNGYLPTTVDISRYLHDKLDPRKFSAAATTAYHLATWQHDAPAIKRRDYAALYPYPSRRAQLITLLDTSSYTEFEAVERAARGGAEFLGHGPTTALDSPSVTMTATIAYVVDISIDPQWAASTSPFTIGNDIIECANQIRDQRPRFHETGSWAGRSDEELENEVQEYRTYLSRKSA